MNKFFRLGIIFILFPTWIIGQSANNATIEGRVFNPKNNEPVPFANVVIWGTTIGSVTDLDGRFLFTGLKPGFIEMRASSIGYSSYVSEQIQVTNAKKVFIDIPLEESNIELNEITVKASPFRRSQESPVSLRRIGISEIEKNPGGNRDISKVIQSFPGVASSVSFRNDIIVRGGGPSENRFYLDDVEIPNINHFATQGASGGPVGIINVDFIREVNFYSSAFPVNQGNALSSVLDFKQIDGNADKLKFKGSVGASDVALTMDGPLTKNTTFVVSARRSYLQFLFSLIGLPFLPTYNDFQFKTRTRIDEKNEITFVGLGAIDQFRLNLDANKTENQRYILRYLPVNEQWNYTVGTVYKHFREKSYDTWVLSRNYLNNTSYKYLNNIEVDTFKTLDYDSHEIENKFRYENTGRPGNGFKTNYGAGFEYAKYYNRTFAKYFSFGEPQNLINNANLELFKWSIFGSITKSLFEERLSLTLGLRSDANDYSTQMSNMFKQLSPRFGGSYSLRPNLFLNFNAARYYQLPSYTTMGHSDSTGVLLNKQNKITYISADHFVTGIEMLPNNNSKVTLEGFFKHYQNYPMSLRDGVSIASKGADFGTFGDEEVTSSAEGRAYGFEVFYRNKDIFGFNLIVSYTYVRSEFENEKGDYLPSSWDNRHLLNITGTRNFKNNWYFGFKWRYVGGAPYTPYDEFTTSLKSAWDARQQPYLDYSQFNSLRFTGFQQLDLRIDKEFFFNKWSLILYTDVQNVYNFKSESQDLLLPVEDENGVILPASGNPAKYKLNRIKSDGSGTVLPTIGIIVEF